MLDELKLSYVYREYREDPLSEEEITKVLGYLGMTARELLRPKESKAFGISANMAEHLLIAAMAKEPTLIQRPICIDGDRAILARPAGTLHAFLS